MIGLSFGEKNVKIYPMVVLEINVKLRVAFLFAFSIFWTIIFFYIKYVPVKTAQFRPKIRPVNKLRIQAQRNFV